MAIRVDSYYGGEGVALGKVRIDGTPSVSTPPVARTATNIPLPAPSVTTPPPAYAATRQDRPRKHLALDCLLYLTVRRGPDVDLGPEEVTRLWQAGWNAMRQGDRIRILAHKPTSVPYTTISLKTHRRIEYTST